MLVKLSGMKKTKAGRVKLALLMTLGVSLAAGVALKGGAARSADRVKDISPGVSVSGAPRAGRPDGLLQFTSGGHALGFREDGYFVSNGTYALSVGFVGANLVPPDAGRDGSQTSSYGVGTGVGSSAAPPLSRVTYANLWDGITVTYDTGQMTETAPIAWQDIAGRRVPVKVSFRLHKSQKS